MFALSLVMFMSSSLASEQMSEGDILSQDSIVFSLEEAESLKGRILELEESERQLQIYKDLYTLEESKSALLEDSVEVYKLKENNYSSIIDNYEKIIEEKDSQLKYKKLENTSYFLLGATTIIGSFYLTNSVIKSTQ